MSPVAYRSTALLVAITTTLVIGSRYARSEVYRSILDRCHDNCNGDEDVKCSYGPSDCEPRGTLFQWSYGTSFSGGPDLDEPLVSDRPDFTESSVTVGRGVTQIEMGYTYTFDEEGADSTKSHSYPEVLLRHGILAEWLELRIFWNYGNASGFAGGGPFSVSGAEDLGLGLKIALTPQEGILPEMAIIPQMSVPTGSAAVTASEVLPGVNWVYSWEVTEWLSIGGSTQGNRVLDETTSDAYWETAQSLVTGISLTDRIGAYIEWFAFFPHSADTAKPEHFLDGGFTYLINDNIQLDVFGGLGLNRAADDYFVGTGAVFRF